MASAPEKTASTHRSSVARGTHEFQIVGYSARRPFSRVTSISTSTDDLLIKSGAFQVGGYTWDLACNFHSKGYEHLRSITLELLGTDVAEDVVATASLRIDDPHGRLPAAVWRSDEANTFSAKKVDSRCWNLPLPDAFRGYEDCYVSMDDRLTILCTVEVFKEDASATGAEPTKCFVSAVPPPTIPGDIHKLLLLLEKHPETSDVTFVVEDTEIVAHRLVLAMRSPVFAAELLGHMRESTTRRVQIHDMSASTFRAMLRFIYSDEFPLIALPRAGKASLKESNVVESRIVRRPMKVECTATSRESMVRDLLVAADRYDLERLRLMCENILVESIDITTVIPTLMLVRGWQSCHQLENCCIEYMISDPDVYAAVRATEEYKELKKTCNSFIVEVNEKVATHVMARYTSSSSPSSSNRTPPEKSMSMFNLSEVIRGTHEFRIPNFSSVQRSHGIGQIISSSIFKVGGYDWKMNVYPSGHYLKDGLENPEEYISVYLHLVTDPGTSVKVSERFRIDAPSGKFLPNVLGSKAIFTTVQKTLGFQKFITVKSAKSRYTRHDGSLTIHCDIDITKEAYTTGATTVARPIVDVPPSNFASQLEQLMVTEKGLDVTFLVEGSEIHAHQLVIAVRARLLLEGAVLSATNKIVRIDDMKAVVFKAVIHFVYTDELPPVDDAVVAGEMLAAACRFSMNSRMKAMCENLVAQLITKDNALSVLELAWSQQCKELQLYCEDFISLAMK